MSKSQAVHFLESKDQPDPEQILYAIRGCVQTIYDVDDLRSLDQAAANRISEVVIAATILADQLCDRITSAPRRAKGNSRAEI